MRSTMFVRLLARVLVLPAFAGGVGAAALLPVAAIHAQTTVGNVRGVVTSTGGAPVSDVNVVARHVETNQQRGALTAENGSYYLGSLRPGVYEITARRIGLSPQTRRIPVQIGQTLDINFTLTEAVTQLTTVEVTATATTAETRTSEVATNVTREQINNLPTASRNFLDLAALAPGTRVQPDRLDGTSKTFAAGAQPATNVNVFVDGMTYKNDIQAGGVAGQQDSRGNAFPRNAVQEFRVTTSNFKAEYQKSTSAIISAVTRSGTNTWEGSAFTTLQNQSFVALDSFARRDRATNANYSRPDYRRYLAGLSLGGPIVRDRLFFFGSYEGNYQNRQGVTRFNGAPATWPANVAALNGESHVSPFRSNLLFGKISYNPSERQLFEFTTDARIERETKRFANQGGCCQNRSYQAADVFHNNVYSGRVKHTLYGSNKTNEAQLGYQRYDYKPRALNPNLVGRDYSGIGIIGGSDNDQDLLQQRITLRDDFTYSGFRRWGSHQMKTGGNVDFVRYDVTKRSNENPTFFFNSSNNFAFPTSARIEVGNPNFKANNAQVGLYAQDDWSPIERLTLNIGVRWDYESKMYNTNYVTPRNVVDSITAYASRLFKPIDPDRYFTDGNDRKNFYGAFQPRLGFSYGIDRNSRTTIFGGAGIFYDRHPFNSFLDESFRAQHPQYNFNFGATADPVSGRLAWNDAYLSRQGLLNILASGRVPAQEIFLLPNDLKPPRSNQFSAGVRQDFGRWNASLTYTGTRSYNGFSFEWANFTLNPNGSCCYGGERLVPAYRNILVGNNNVHTWYNALLFQIDRPYRRVRDFGWGAGLAYTLAKAEQQGRGDLFNFPYVNAFEGDRFEINNSERHRIVMNGLVDVPYLWGIQASTLITLGSGYRFGRVVENPPPLPNTENPNTSDPTKYNFIIPKAFAYRNVDVRLRKDFLNVAGNRLAVTADVFNVFNFDNFGCFDNLYRRLNGTVNPTYGNPGCVIADARRFQAGLQYDFQPRIGRGSSR